MVRYIKMNHLWWRLQLDACRIHRHQSLADSKIAENWYKKNVINRCRCSVTPALHLHLTDSSTAPDRMAGHPEPDSDTKILLSCNLDELGNMEVQWLNPYCDAGNILSVVCFSYRTFFIVADAFAASQYYVLCPKCISSGGLTKD